MGAEGDAVALVMIAVEILPEQRAVSPTGTLQQLQAQRLVLASGTAHLGLGIAARRLAHGLRTARLGAAQRRQTQQALRAQPLQHLPAFQILQPSVGALPLQQFTYRARDLGDAQRGELRHNPSHHLQFCTGKTPAAKSQRSGQFGLTHKPVLISFQFRLSQETGKVQPKNPGPNPF